MVYAIAHQGGIDKIFSIWNSFATKGVGIEDWFREQEALGLKVKIIVFYEPPGPVAFTTDKLDEFLAYRNKNPSGKPTII